MYNPRKGTKLSDVITSTNSKIQPPIFPVSGVTGSVIMEVPVAAPTVQVDLSSLPKGAYTVSNGLNNQAIVIRK